MIFIDELDDLLEVFAGVLRNRDRELSETYRRELLERIDIARNDLNSERRRKELTR